MAPPLGPPPEPAATPTGLVDRLGRPSGVLRLSLTARCNLACVYCRPDPHDAPGLLSHAERLLLVRVAAGLGWRRLRLTGGEPLLVPDLERLVADVAATGLLHDIALTTNGLLLDREAGSCPQTGRPAPHHPQPGRCRSPHRAAHGRRQQLSYGAAGR